MKFLVTGCDGLLGGYLMEELGSSATGLDLPDLDVTSAGSVEAAVSRERPDCILNCAAMTDVDLCERDPSGAEAINAGGVGNLVATGIRLLTVSTDQVFDDGDRDVFREDAPVNPANAYARSKHEGEKIALGNEGNAVIRTSWLFGGRSGMVPRFWELVKGGASVRAVTDQTSSITYAGDLASEMVSIALSGGSGIFHRVNRGSLTPYDIALRLSELAGDGSVTPVTWEELGVDARRPSFSVLGTGRGRLLPDAWDAVERWMERDV